MKFWCLYETIFPVWISKAFYSSTQQVLNLCVLKIWNLCPPTKSLSKFTLSIVCSTTLCLVARNGFSGLQDLAYIYIGDYPPILFSQPIMLCFVVLYICFMSSGKVRSVDDVVTVFLLRTFYIRRVKDEPSNQITFSLPSPTEKARVTA